MIEIAEAALAALKVINGGGAPARRRLSPSEIVERARVDVAALLEDDVVTAVVALDDLAMMRLRQVLGAARVKVPSGWVSMISGRQRDAARRAVVEAGGRDFERGDHVELGRALIEELRSDAPVVADMNAIYSYDHGRGTWTAVDQDDCSKVVQTFAGAWVIGGKAPAPLKIKAADVKGSIELARQQVSRKGFFAAATPGLCFADGFVTLDGDTIVVEPHHAEHAARFAYDFAYDPRASCARWLGCLAGAFQDDPDAEAKIALIQEFGGASLFGMATKYQRCLMLTGDGANAKSTIAEIIEAAFPPGSTCAVAPQKWGEDYRLALIAGKILNVVLELPEDDIMVPGEFKIMIDGGQTSGRQIRQEAFSFHPRAGHLFAANRLPGTTDHTHGFWRRWLVIEFHRIFQPHEQNPNLRDEIVAAELPGIVAWLVEGARRLAARGRYAVPSGSTRAIERWRRDADPVALFVGEKTRPAKSDVERTSAATIFASYVTWAETNKYRVMSKGKFGQRMRGLRLGSQHTRTGEVYPLRLRSLGEPDLVEDDAPPETAPVADPRETEAEEAWR